MSYLLGSDDPGMGADQFDFQLIQTKTIAPATTIPFNLATKTSTEGIPGLAIYGTYENFKLIVHGVISPSGHAALQFRMGVSLDPPAIAGGGADYGWSMSYLEATGTRTTAAPSGEADVTESEVFVSPVTKHDQDNTDSPGALTVEVDVYGTLKGDNWTYCKFQTVYVNQPAGNLVYCHGGGVMRKVAAVTGFRVQFNGLPSFYGTANLYGIKGTPA